jgi:hypothetical protein
MAENPRFEYAPLSGSVPLPLTKKERKRKKKGFSLTLFKE